MTDVNSNSDALQSKEFVLTSNVLWVKPIKHHHIVYEIDSEVEELVSSLSKDKKKNLIELFGNKK